MPVSSYSGGLLQEINSFKCLQQHELQARFVGHVEYKWRSFVLALQEHTCHNKIGLCTQNAGNILGQCNDQNCLWGWKCPYAGDNSFSLFDLVIWQHG